MKRIFTPVKKKSILLIDDDQLCARAYRQTFQQRGLLMEVATSAAAAMQQLEQDATGLVLLDLGLLASDGLELLKEIRAKFPALPVLAFVNPYLSSVARAAIEAGASKCITKGSGNSAELVNYVCECLAPGRHVLQVGTAFSEDLVAPLLNNATELLGKLRASHQVFARTDDEESRRVELMEMHRHVRSLAAAGLAGLCKIAQMRNAFEALLMELQAKPKKITPSVIRTVAQAIDALASLFARATDETGSDEISRRILVVDDEVISRETICAALERAGLVGTGMNDSVAALTALEQESFDLIFLDVEMPGLTGFELCVKIREMATNRATPVVFVTAHSDFASRAQSALSGGNDFITKPIISGELAVKAFACLFKEKPRAPSQIPLAMPSVAMEELMIAAPAAV